MRYVLVTLILASALMNSIPLIHAHGTGQHVMGTVTAIDATHVEVKAPKGKMVSVTLTPKTRYRSKGGALTRPQVGDRVVIEAFKDGATLTAMEIQFATPGGKAKPVH
ncbi:MAG: DUF5666 domain-containing protein [Nitrospiraceae bacterium]